MWFDNYMAEKERAIEREKQHKQEIINLLTCLSEDECEALMDLAKEHSLKMKKKKIIEQCRKKINIKLY